MDPPPLAAHKSIWYCPALSVPPLFIILTDRGGRVVVITIVIVAAVVVDDDVVIIDVVIIAVVIIAAVVEHVEGAVGESFILVFMLATENV